MFFRTVSGNRVEGEMAGGQVDGQTSEPQMVQVGSLNSCYTSFHLLTRVALVLYAKMGLVMGVSCYILPVLAHLLGL